jgi:GrpB-like predicted nucleotidyltransferase (UPF0157 family)
MFEQERRSLHTCSRTLCADYRAYWEYSGARPWLPGELFFRKALAGPWTHHLHIFLQGDDPRWQDRLLFRDNLRSHPEAAATYAKLKRDLAAAFNDDISGYRNAKDAFVAATMARGPARDGDRQLLRREA